MVTNGKKWQNRLGFEFHVGILQSYFLNMCYQELPTKHDKKYLVTMPMYSILTCWPYHAKYRRLKRLKLDSCDIRRNTYKTCTCRSIIYDVTFQTLSEQIMSILKERLRTHSMYVGILKEAKLFEQCAKTWQAKIFWVYRFAAATIDTFMHLLRYALSECF